MFSKSFYTIPIILSFAFLSAGCAGKDAGSSVGAGGRQLVSYEEMQQEFKQTVLNLQWPENYKIPQDVSGEDSSARYQKGYGDTQASMAYECAWEKEWLATYSSDSSRAAAAINALEKVPSMGYMSPERADDATRRFFKDYLDRAKLGDPSGFQENVSANCP